MIIYSIKNKINGKIYIGQSRQSARLRWRGHKSDAINGKGSSLHRSMRKHGINAFEIREEYNVSSPEELDMMEKYYIASYQSSNPKIGYNLTAGGRNHNPSREFRRKLRRARNKRGPASEITKKRMSDSHKGLTFSDTHIANIRKSAKERSRKCPEATKARMILMSQRRPSFASDLTKSKMSASQKARWRARKQLKTK